MNKLISTTLAIVTVLQFSIPTTFAAPTFAPLSDIAGHEYQAAIEYLYSKSIINGYDDGTFKPDNSINRAELLKILVGGAGYAKPDATVYKNCFPDVKNDWYAPYVCFAKEKNWINGYSDGNFRPAQAINKVEAIKMLMVMNFPPALNAGEKTSIYADVDFKQWYGQYMYVAEAMKILNMPGTQYHPAEFITRGEISNNMYRAMLILDQKVGSFDQVDMNQANESVNPSAPTVQVTSQTYGDITLAVKLPTYTGNSALNSVFSSFTNPNSGMSESGSTNIEGKNPGDIWTTTYHVNPKLDAVETPVYTFTFWVDNKNGKESEKINIQVSGLTANPGRPSAQTTLITKNSIEFLVNPPIYTGNSSLSMYRYSIDASSDTHADLGTASYTKNYFENTLHNKLSLGSTLKPDTSYTVSFWVINALDKESAKITMIVKTLAN